MSKIDTAALLFKEGFNCAQSLLTVYGVELGLSRDTALKIGSAFGSGMGNMGETCGVVTGAFMVIGLKSGTVDVKDKKGKAKINKLVKKFTELFKSRNNSIICRELLGHEPSSLKNLNPFVRKKIKAQCSIYVRDAAEIIEEII